jgi:hypothetical protein
MEITFLKASANLVQTLKLEIMRYQQVGGKAELKNTLRETAVILLRGRSLTHIAPRTSTVALKHQMKANDLGKCITMELAIGRSQLLQT